jgi:hypothetical protein
MALCCCRSRETEGGGCMSCRTARTAASYQTPSCQVGTGSQPTGAVVASVLVLCLCAFVPRCVPSLHAQVPQNVTVVGVAGFRPTPVLLPHFQFWVAVDTAAGGVVLRDLTINPTTFTGWVRIEGIAPGARAPENPLFPDSVRFAADGRVTLMVADSAIRGMIEVEPQGVVGVSAGRIEIRAPRWPLNRAVLVTVDPADLYEHRWRSVGYGVRDRIRVDDARHVAFLQDSTIANEVIAVAPGRGTRAAIRVEQTSIVLTLRYGDNVGRERRPLARLVMALEPTREADGGMHAELVFGSGESEEAAASAAAVAMEEGEMRAQPPGPRVSTPSLDASTLLAHILGAAWPMLRYDRIATFRNIPAGAYTFLAAFDRDGWYGATTALQLRDAEVVCSEYGLMKQYADPSGAQRHEIWNRLRASGHYVWTDDWGGHWMGDKDPYEILKAYACYRATRDTAWLAGELANLRRIARYVLATDLNGNGLVEGMSYATYSEMSPLSANDHAYRTEDPYVNALAAYALDRLAEMEDEGAWRLNAQTLGDSAAAWRAAAARIRAALPTLYRPQMAWFSYHAMADSGRSWDHYHLQPVDALIFNGVADTAIRAAMVHRLLGSQWWDARNQGFFAVPSNDSWFDLKGYWTGWDWHILDFKALEAAFRFGTAAERREAWHRLDGEASRIVRVNYGRPGERGDNNGLFMFSAGAYLDLLARGLFGVDEHLDAVEVAPHVDGIADDVTWRLDNWRITSDSLSIAYRPSDRAATLTLGARRPARLLLRFPWLVRGSCAQVSRPNVAQFFDLMPQDGGWASIDVAGGADPAAVRVTAASCPRPG